VDVTCFGGSNGSTTITLIDSNTTSRAGAFSYTVKDSSGITDFSSVSASAGPVVISNLKAGVYTITVTLSKAPFCSVTKKFTISQPISALSLTESHSDISCILGNNDGKITALTTGGWSDFYEYKWEKDGTLIQDWGDVTNLFGVTQGNYQVSVRDAKGCQVQKLVSLNNPTPISFTAASDTSILRCFADRTATISATTVSGGQGSNYWYTLNQISPNVVNFGQQASNEFKNLGIGKYTLKVNDNWSCEARSVVIEIKEPDNVVATLALKTPPTCVNAAILDLQIAGGTPPYSYSTNNVNFNLVIPNPINGNIGVNHYFIKDSNGCGSYLSNDIVIELPNGLSVSTDKTFAKINCTGESTASILATAQGGLGNYTYILLDNSNLPIGLPNATGVFTGLKAGSYKVKVSSADCAPSYSSVINIEEPPAKLNPKYILTDALCAGSNDGTVKVNTLGGTVAINYAISPNLSQFTESNLFKNLGVGTYDVLVQDALGCYEKNTLTINEPAALTALTIATSIVQELCFDDKNAQFSIILSGGILPYKVALDNPSGTYTTGTASQYQFDFNGLKGGSHTVYVKDANNCTFDWTVNLDDSVKLDPIVSVNYNCVSNAQHSLVTVTLDSSISNLTLVQFALDGGSYQSSNVFSNLSPGDHFIRVKHNNGCIKDTSVFNILKIEPLTLSLKEGGLNEIIAVANGGAGNYKFTFDGEFTGSNANYIYYKTQDYEVTVQEANGCTASVTQKFDYIDICVPNYFTPNGDGTSDTWAPGCTVNYKNLTFTVLDRYGRKIQSYNYGESWDGKYNGLELPSGDYWYVLKLNSSKDDREFVGHFTLYR
jgi:gliding motility-associated-like protein